MFPLGTWCAEKTDYAMANAGEIPGEELGLYEDLGRHQHRPITSEQLLGVVSHRCLLLPT